MNYIKNTLICILLLLNFTFAKKSENLPKVNYAKVIYSDIYSTIIEFELDNFELIPIGNSDMHIANFTQGASLLKKDAPDIHKYSRSIIIPDDAKMAVEILS